MASREKEVRDIVRRVLYRTLGLSQSGSGPATPEPRARSYIGEETVANVERGGRLVAPPGAHITPLARQVALERGITIVDGGAAAERGPSSIVSTQTNNKPEGRRTVAIGADHGGVALKDTLKAYLEELGYTPADCGAHSTDPVDYPDIALAVAEWVSGGRAWRGILIDGAGIGSCMAANKVPGVRAALCYDQATALNSREHNDANVLTLGAGLIGATLAKQIVKTWLETEFGGGRHARRVDKITAIEKRFSK
jgi:ribose 5-phosphate isomerase B